MKMGCYNCQNFEQEYEGQECLNYKPRLPKVTMKEVGLKYWEFANDSGAGACLKVKEFFGITNMTIGCTGLKCGQCIQLFVSKINKERGYEEE